MRGCRWKTKARRCRRACAGRLFDSMVSVRREHGGDVPHLGLGLYIVRLIAEFHGGSVRADNRADGRGVVITVSMPEARSEP